MGKTSSTYFLGTCRALHPWVSLAGDRFIGVGTHLKYYINEGGAYQDVTPIRLTTSAGDVTFNASANTLSASVAIGDTSLALTSSSGFPGAGVIKINSEIIRYASISGNSLLGLERGFDSTTEAAHSSSAAVTCATLTVTDTAHGCENNDFVTFSGTATLGDQITANVLNQEYQISSIVSDNSYLIEAREVASLNSVTTPDGYDPTYVFATTSDSGNGGSSVVGAYQINTGLDTTLGGSGWGAGTWARGTWGSGASISTAVDSLRIWSHDNFWGRFTYKCKRWRYILLGQKRQCGSYVWSGCRAFKFRWSKHNSNYSQKKVLVSDRDRHIIAFGCDSEDNIGTQDPLLIRFSSQESLTDWENNRREYSGRLAHGSGSEIVTAVETRQQILVFTDVSLHAMQFLGPPFTFGINTLSENITIAGPLAAIAY